MSRLLVAIVTVSTAAHTPLKAQEVYGPVPVTEEADADPVPLVAERPCETAVQEDGVILVCRELDESERYRSPIPREVQSDRVIIPGLTDPPCWVTNPGAVGTPACMRIGWAPEPALMIDVTAFPEPLSDEEAAQVSETDGGQQFEEAPLGERVPIDLSDDN